MTRDGFRFGSEFVECTCDHPAADHDFDNGCGSKDRPVSWSWQGPECDCQWWDEDVPAEYRGK